jgi:membrane-bound lytic murein transglycosylase B
MSPGRLVVAVFTALMAIGGFGYAAAQTMTRAPLELAPPLQQSAAAPSPVTPTAPAQRAQQTATTHSVDPGWVADIAARSGIPAPAVRAYANAQLGEPETCEVGWTTLAGIGWIESQHGTLGGRILGDDGHSDTPILGPALDGAGGYAAIRSTEQTVAWHGDRSWDHAVGPMQFIPSTWEQWGTDGDGDGTADPNDIDDAASTAVAYLCADGHDLTSGAGWADAIFGYNHDQSYVDSVHAAAEVYAERTS